MKVLRCLCGSELFRRTAHTLECAECRRTIAAAFTFGTDPTIEHWCFIRFDEQGNPYDEKAQEETRTVDDATA